MADLLPNRGAVVRRFGPVELREMYHTRRILEVEATRCACGQVDRDTLAGSAKRCRTCWSIAAAIGRSVR